MSGGAKPGRNWDIALSAWIIQDGNYPDFSAGQRAEFAVEFWVPEAARIERTTSPVAAVHRGDCLYDTVADVVLRSGDITVLDIGLLIYRETSSLACELKAGSRYSLQLGLSVDPFFYFEGMSGVPEIPPLIYTWRIHSILQQTAPFVETVVGGERIRRRDQHQLV